MFLLYKDTSRIKKAFDSQGTVLLYTLKNGFMKHILLKEGEGKSKGAIPPIPKKPKVIMRFIKMNRKKEISLIFFIIDFLMRHRDILEDFNNYGPNVVFYIVSI
jgi:hypothetical protein